MLYRLEIENFYSVRMPQVIDLRISAKVPEFPGRFANLHIGSEVRVPKIVTLFGPNGSGKSTVLRALAFLSWFIQHSFRLPPTSDQPPPGSGFQPCERFFSKEAAGQPTRLCVHFTGPVNLFDPQETWKEFCRYSYEVAFESSAGKPRNIVLESFRQWPKKSGKSVRVFERSGNKVTGSKLFSLSGYQNVIDKVRSNSSLVSTLSQFDHKPSLFLREVAAQVTSNLLVEKFEVAESAILQWYNTTPEVIQSLNKELERIDVGIRAMRLEAGPQGPIAWFDHDGLSVPVPMNLESHGTRQFVRIFPIVARALSNGGIAVIDELDQSIHPRILSEIIRWFYDANRNPHDAQLWMTCQNPSILEELQKEEVVFCEKDNSGRTKLYGLQDVESVRRSDNLYKKYLGGVYGATPNVG